MSRTLFTNARIFDGVSADCPEGMHVLIEGSAIRRDLKQRPFKGGTIYLICKELD